MPMRNGNNPAAGRAAPGCCCRAYECAGGHKGNSCRRAARWWLAKQLFIIPEMEPVCEIDPPYVVCEGCMKAWLRSQNWQIWDRVVT
ncbi:MAG: hypothetical protein AB1486_18710 [Planctomycetota bacterium]